MSYTVFRRLVYPFCFFFSREEPRMHVHVSCTHGYAKFWLGLGIALEENCGMRSEEIERARAMIGEHEDEIRDAWRRDFGG